MKLIDVKASISNLNSGVFAFVLIAIVNLTILSIANAEEAPPGDWLKQATQTIKKQDAILKKSTSEKINVKTLSNYLNDINGIKGKALECITGTETQLQKVTEDLKTLGKPSAKESKEVIKKRSSLSAMQKELDKQLSSCKLLQLQSQDLIKAINKP